MHDTMSIDALLEKDKELAVIFDTKTLCKACSNSRYHPTPEEDVLLHGGSIMDELMVREGYLKFLNRKQWIFADTQNGVVYSLCTQCFDTEWADWRENGWIYNPDTNTCQRKKSTIVKKLLGKLSWSRR